jgi:thiol-disulfide isomerase/thioredoxin
VLVDFWASWCMPCRESNRGLVTLYNKYHDLGFEIFSVSLDNDPIKWHQAIKDDSMQWFHVNEIRSWRSDVVRTWRVWKLPSSFFNRQGGHCYFKRSILRRT